MHIKVRVTTNSDKESFKQTAEDAFTISVKEKAEHGRANRRVQELLGSHFEKPAGAFRIVSGHHAPHKIIEIQNND